MFKDHLQLMPEAIKELAEQPGGRERLQAGGFMKSLDLLPVRILFGSHKFYFYLFYLRCKQ